MLLKDLYICNFCHVEAINIHYISFLWLIMSKEIKGYVNKPKMSHGPQGCQDPTCLIWNAYMHITLCRQLQTTRILMIIANQVKAITLQTTTKSNYIYNVGENDYH